MKLIGSSNWLADTPMVQEPNRNWTVELGLSETQEYSGNAEMKIKKLSQVIGINHFLNFWNTKKSNLIQDKKKIRKQICSLMINIV